jgi:anti-sigma B factor antagonist
MTTAFSVLQPTGILDGNHGNEIRNQVINLVGDGNRTVLIDFREVTFMNSSGIGALVATLKAVRSSNSALYICSLSDQVKIIFNLTKMDKIFKPFENRQEFEQKVLATSCVEHVDVE